MGDGNDPLRHPTTTGTVIRMLSETVGASLRGRPLVFETRYFSKGLDSQEGAATECRPYS